MITRIQEHIKSLLEAQGVRDVVLDAGGLTEHRGRKYAVVLPGRERVMEGQGRIALEQSPDGTRTYVREVLSRSLPVDVYCFDADLDSLENIAIGLLAGLRNGLEIDGTWVAVTDRNIEWQLPHSQLRELKAALVRITFRIPVLESAQVARLEVTQECEVQNG